MKKKEGVTKKLVSFSSYKKIQDIIKDEAELNSVSESSIIENHIFNDIFPKDSGARFIVETSLYPEDGTGSVGNTLAALFRDNSAGINWKSKHDNFKPVVEFSRKILTISGDSILNGNEPTIHHLASQLDSITEKLKILAQNAEEPLERQNYNSGYKFSSELYDGINQNPSGFNLIDIFLLILEYWDDLDDWTRTYRLLGDAASLCTFPNTPKYKLMLLKLIKEISSQWSNEG